MPIVALAEFIRGIGLGIWNRDVSLARPDHDRSGPGRKRACGELSRTTIAILFVGLLAGVAIPILTHPTPPLSDYVNHLARAHVLAAIDSDPDLARFYRIEWQVVPNLMMDIVVPVLHRFMDIYRAGQAFTILAFVAIVSGALALHRALFGRWSAVPLLACPLLYNGVFLVGVLNYIFGIGLALWALAAWAALRERSRLWRIALSTLFATALYLCHLFALGLYGLGLLAFETCRLWARRDEPLAPRLADFAAAGVAFIPPLLLLLASPTWGHARESYWSLAGKLDGLMLAIFVYDLDFAASLAAAVAVAAAAAWAASRGALRVHPLGWAVLALGALIYFALPRELFGSHLADQRLPIGLAFLLIACLQVDLPTPRARAAFVAALVVLTAFRVIEMQTVWDRLAPVTDAFHRSVMSIERGARVLVTYGERGPVRTNEELGLMHAASLATIERSALVTTAFCVPGKHILQVREPFRKLVDTRDGRPPSAAWLRMADGSADESERHFWSQWSKRFDYVYVIFATQREPNPDITRLELVTDGPGFRLYRVIEKAGLPLTFRPQ